MKANQNSMNSAENTKGVYRKRPAQVHAVRWWRNGDHPGDGPSSREGKIVKHYRDQAVHVGTVCPYCMEHMLDHGWIEAEIIGYIVCPGDWVVTHDNGETYPVTDDSFQRIYERVPDKTVEKAPKIRAGVK